MEKWGGRDSSMGIDHKQEEYSRALATCDGVVVLFWCKFGVYTESESVTALRGARSGGSVHLLAVLFKETEETPLPELADCKKKCPSLYGVEPIYFSSDGELRSRFPDLVVDSILDINPDFAVPDESLLSRYRLV